MKQSLLAFLAALALGGCATPPPAPPAEDCCGPKEIVYIDKPITECTRAVQKVTQVNPCAACSNFELTARAGNGCARLEVR